MNFVMKWVYSVTCAMNKHEYEAVRVHKWAWKFAGCKLPVGTDSVCRHCGHEFNNYDAFHIMVGEGIRK